MKLSRFLYSSHKSNSQLFASSYIERKDLIFENLVLYWTASKSISSQMLLLTVALSGLKVYNVPLLFGLFISFESLRKQGKAIVQ